MQTSTFSDFAHDEIIHSLIHEVNEHYIFPDIAKEIENYFEQKLLEKAYEEITCPEAFCQQITSDLQQISNDKHLRLRYTKLERSVHKRLSEKEQMEEHLRQAKVNNFGFHKVERLPGNIGYIDLRVFYDPMFAGEFAVNVMNLVNNTDALIFDLRNNGGGSPFMVALITSYLFDSEPIHLNSFHSRLDEFIEQSWTLPYVPGKRYVDKPVYVLTSCDTFSAAEEFSYNLINLKRATVIGEVTKGGANPGASHQLTKHFNVFIPHGQAISPITQTNWEGKGVIPDINMKSEKAFETAYQYALNYVINHYQDRVHYDFLIKEAKDQLKQLA